jgi:GH25 family lysozyme M1 (1,4-beta-N-acetylmuramidase)
VCSSDLNADATQGWTFTAVQAMSDSYYNIINEAASNYMDVNGMSPSAEANVQIWQPTGTGAQVFKTTYSEASGTGTYQILNAFSKLSLDVQDGNFIAGNNIWQYPYNGNDAQVWKIVPTGDGWFTIQLACNTNLCITAALPGSGSNVQLGTIVNGAPSSTQKWRFNLTAWNGGSMNGIDVSGYQPYDIGSMVNYDFMVVKATEGTDYTNPNARQQASDALWRGACLGFYHFADGGDPVAEADHFVNTVYGYGDLGKSTLWLDFETDTADNRSWCTQFCNEVYSRSAVLNNGVGIKCGIYSNANTYTNTLNDICASLGVLHWNANYWYGYQTFNGYNPNIVPQIPCDMYQYTSSGYLSGYTGNLDFDVFYSGPSSWIGWQ